MAVTCEVCNELFVRGDGQPWQKVYSAVLVHLSVHDMPNAHAEASRIADILTGFSVDWDLVEAP